MPVASAPPLNIALLDLRRDQCRWPVSGISFGMLFCGHVTPAGRPYCRAHLAIASAPAKKRGGR